MNETYTPGPWALETVRTSSGLCHKVGPFPWKAGKENHACIYDDYPAHGSKGTPELIANARLISASPDLLEALKSVMEALRKDAPGTPLNNHKYDQLGIIAYAAIAKAEGRS